MAADFHDDAELYGQELIDGVRRWVQPDIAGIEQRLQETERTLKQQRIERALDNDPVTRDRWRKVNVDPEFVDKWLSEVHELSGERRRDILKRSEFYGNADAVVAMFKSFILEQMPGRVDAHKPLPYGTARAPAPSGSTRIWTRAEIRDHYEAARKGKLSEAERARIEAEILAAARENRIKDPPMVLTKGSHV
jgi:hypothetical protein